MGRSSLSSIITKGDSVRVAMPPTLSSAYNNVPGQGRILSKNARAWKSKHHSLIALSLKRIDGPVRIGFVYHLGASFKGDLSNRIKLAEDALKSAGIIADDNHNIVIAIACEIGEPTGRSDSEMTIRVVPA
jgi:Holliday junction resolvase RusA-like endonuclease